MMDKSFRIRSHSESKKVIKKAECPKIEEVDEPKSVIQSEFSEQVVSL